MANSKDISCDLHVSRTAIEWCSQCEQKLCSDCIEYHRQAKSSKCHKTIPMDHFDKLPSSFQSIKRMCDQHGELISAFCPEHDCVCFFYCLQYEHKQCGGIENLEKVAEAVKHCPLMEDVENTLKDINFNFDKILEDCTLRLSDLDKHKITVSKKINDAKNALLTMLDNLEKKMLSELTGIISLEKSKASNLEIETRQRKQTICRMSTDLTTIKKYATHTDIFLALQEMIPNFQREENFLVSLQGDSRLSKTEIDFEKSIDLKTCFKNAKYVGRFVTTIRPTSLEFEQSKKKQAQDIQRNQQNQGKNENPQELPTKIPQIYCSNDFQIVTPKFVKQLLVSGKNTHITSCKIIAGTGFLFVDCRNRCLILHGIDGRFIRCIKLSNEPYDVTIIGKNIVAITMYLKSTVSLVDINEGREMRSLKTVGLCYGVDCFEDELYVAVPKKKLIQVLDYKREDDLLYTIATPYSVYYLSWCDGFLYCSDHTSNMLFCISTSGRLIWEYYHDSIQTPLAITNSPKSDVYVVCNKSNLVYSISSNGDQGKVFLRHVENIANPQALAICSTSKTLLLCDEGSGHALLYKFT